MKKITIYEGGGYFSLRGNGRFGAVTRTGWRLSRLGERKKGLIKKALEEKDTDKVYRRGERIFKLYMNGVEKEIR